MSETFVPLEDVQGPDYYLHRNGIVHLHIHVTTDDVDIETEEKKIEI